MNDRQRATASIVSIKSKLDSIAGALETAWRQLDDVVDTNRNEETGDGSFDEDSWTATRDATVLLRGVATGQLAEKLQDTIHKLQHPRLRKLVGREK